MSYSATDFHDQLRQSPGLSDAAVRVALILSGYADADGRCWPSQRRVARDLDWCVRKVKYALQELQRTGIVEYQTRARHKGERSTIQLRTGVTVATGARTCTGARIDTGARTCTGARIDTGARFGKQPVQDSAPNRCIDVPPELPQELPHITPPFLTGANTSAPPVEEEDSHSAGEIVAYAVTVARDHGVTPPSARWKGQLGKVAKERLAAGASPANLLLAVERLIVESKTPALLEAVLRDIEGGAKNGRQRVVDEHTYSF